MTDEPTPSIPMPPTAQPTYPTPLSQAPAGPTPAAPKRPTGLIAAGSGVLGLIVGIIVGAAGAGTSDANPQNLATTAPTASNAAPDPGTTETAPEPTDAPVPAESVEPAESQPAAESGTRANPFAIGDAVGNDDWSVTLGAPAESWSAIKAENQFNDPAPKGFDYYMVPVSATYTGANTGNAWLDLTVEFVGDDGVTYSDRCGVLPDNLNDVGELYEGGKAKGNVCVTVPEGAKGLWTLTVGWGDPVFFTASK